MFKRKWLAGLGVLGLSLSILSPAFAEDRAGDIITKNQKVAFASATSTGLSTTSLSPSLTPEQLVQNLLGGGVTVQNVSFNGAATATGTFTGGDGIIGFNDGIILSSGNISNVIGPNNFDGITADNGTPGDTDLNSLIPGYSTQDATVLEFDFIPNNDIISFEYVFSSDEYNEYVNSVYNDVFGFFINGVNAALIPGTTIPVSINNVNGGSHSEFYLNNDLTDGGGSINTEMDGLTKVLFVEVPVNKGVVNHIKMAIADAGDRILDSNVFIKAGSFKDEPISNLPPVIGADNSDVVVNEGQTAINTGTWSDADADDTVNLSAAPGSVTSNSNGTWNWSFNTTDDLNQPVTITADDGTVSTSASFNLIVNNVAPKVDPISVPLDPVPVNTSITASASFTDPGILDTHNAEWNWGDGTTTSGTVKESNGSGSVNDQHTYATPGIYKVQLKVTDDDGGSASVIAVQYVVVYDPSAGFVTGGGWINSPIGAYTADPSMTGKANFGFVSKYKKGATSPDGQTEFQFKAGNLNFHSSSYDWLVIAGAKAQYKGKGTINGSGDYGFMLSAVDGKLSGDGKDKFRIKIWNRTTNEVVYDNQIGAGDDANPTTSLESGSIVIHK
ncbi:choice-of-anchor L domain-containing protein [Neobacillus sp. NRS-1170]|uniref:choice-of-anchor L domain-containing protein n=1 Tax=Neobacillus sp. NRS-1170 TaxID=3233898 RepID=UPI003D2D8688